MQTQAAKFNVLVPQFFKTGLTTTVTSRSGAHSAEVDVCRVEWIVIGEAKDMADAKRKYGGAPVLEARDRFGLADITRH